jgi:hypothetical protein
VTRAGPLIQDEIALYELREAAARLSGSHPTCTGHSDFLNQSKLTHKTTVWSNSLIPRMPVWLQAPHQNPPVSIPTERALVQRQFTAVHLKHVLSSKYCRPRRMAAKTFAAIVKEPISIYCSDADALARDQI